MVAKQSGKEGKLTPKQAAFVNEYLIDLNATQAAIRAGYATGSADVTGARLLVNASVMSAIQKRQKERSERTEITQDMVLNRWWKIATADPNELISYRRVCCRHCFGQGHEYQWIDEAEYERAVDHAHAFAKESGTAPEIPSDAGGFGFDPSLRPHPKCPKCKGEGHGEVFAQDTRFVGEEAKALYAGVKITKEGLEIKMQDQGKAMENVARHLGMFNDKLTLKGEAENPLRMLLEQVQGTPMRPGGADSEQ